MTNKAAAALGRLARGVKKTMTTEAIAQRKRAGFKMGNKAAVRKSNTRVCGPEPAAGRGTQHSVVGETMEDKR